MTAFQLILQVSWTAIDENQWLVYEQRRSIKKVISKYGDQEAAVFSVILWALLLAHKIIIFQRICTTNQKVIRQKLTWTAHNRVKWRRMTHSVVNPWNKDSSVCRQAMEQWWLKGGKAGWTYNTGVIAEMTKPFFFLSLLCQVLWMSWSSLRRLQPMCIHCQNCCLLKPTPDINHQQRCATGQRL